MRKHNYKQKKDNGKIVKTFRFLFRFHPHPKEHIHSFSVFCEKSSQQ